MILRSPLLLLYLYMRDLSTFMVTQSLRPSLASFSPLSRATGDDGDFDAEDFDEFVKSAVSEANQLDDICSTACQLSGRGLCGSLSLT